MLRDRRPRPDLERPEPADAPRAVQPAAPQPDDGERAAGRTPGCGGSVAGAFNRGHVERLRPRVRELAAELLDRGRPGRLRRGGGVRRAAAGPGDRRAARRAHRRWRRELRAWSQAIVRMYEVAPAPRSVVDAAVRAAGEFAGTVRELARPRAADPRDDLVTDLVAAQDGDAGSPRTRWSPRPCCCSTPATRRRSTCSATAWSRCCGRGRGRRADAGADLRRGDAPLRLRAAALRAHRDRAGRGRRRDGRAGAEDRGAARRGQPRPGRLRRPGHVPSPTATPTRTSRSAPACTSASGAPLARMELAESLALLLRELPGLRPRRRARAAWHVRAARLHAPSPCGV